ncbi:hypothetical protein NDU88_007985 [Pleurodeles waltl]|uniref:Uncharacterized protein n=1 Tax=Pleurodeles waltl TaxID=8319 RepID=A0AAV7NXW8_PLEWA|nr:hypothetical protein NDU88_007985 [Pleurodeles waltl]
MLRGEPLSWRSGCVLEHGRARLRCTLPHHGYVTDVFECRSLLPPQFDKHSPPGTRRNRRGKRTSDPVTRGTHARSGLINQHRGEGR